MRQKGANGDISPYKNIKMENLDKHTTRILCFNAIFSENAFVLSHKLKIEVVKNLKPEPNFTYIILGGHDKAYELDIIQQQLFPSIKYIIFQSEQLKAKVFDNKYYLRLLQNNDVYDWSYFNYNKLKRQGYRMKGLYKFKFLELPPDEYVRKIDLFFCGSYSETRDKILKNIKKKYPNLTCIFDLNNSFYNQQKLTILLQRSKYVLNISFYEDNSLETHRIEKALACGCKVISHYSNDNILNEEYNDKVIFTNNIVKKISYLNI